MDEMVLRPLFQDLPLEYNTWLLFRQAVDVILVKWVSLEQHGNDTDLQIVISYLTVCLRSPASVCPRVSLSWYI